VRRALEELRIARINAGVSQRDLAAALGVSQGEIWKLERAKTADVGVVRLAEVASALGYELSIGLHPVGDGIRDKGQQALIGRFRALLAVGWRVLAEAPFPQPGDPRSWDLLLRGSRQVIGVEAETRIRDVQELVRRMRGREQDGGTDIVLLVLSDSAHNRRLVAEVREALGERWAATPRAARRALREGGPLPGSGVVLA
jgi:transcriptional regulator with XRE-family HTH domain